MDALQYHAQPADRTGIFPASIPSRRSLILGAAAVAVPSLPAVAVAALPATAKQIDRFRGFEVTDNHAFPRAFKGDIIAYDTENREPIDRGYFVTRTDKSDRLFLVRAVENNGRWYAAAPNALSESLKVVGPMSREFFRSKIQGAAITVSIALNA